MESLTYLYLGLVLFLCSRITLLNAKSTKKGRQGED